MDTDTIEREKYLLEKETQQTTPYNVVRGPEFKNLIRNILIKKGNIRRDFVDDILTDDNMKLYEDAFTFSSVNSYKDEITGKIKKNIESSNNNDIYIKLGTSVYEYFIVWYVYRLFDYKKASDVKFIATIRKNYEINIYGENISKELGFLPYISSSLYEHNNDQKTLLKNVFKAFLGVTSHIFDIETKNGIGNSICYDILKNIFKGIEIKTSVNIYEIENPISVLNEFFMKNHNLDMEMTMEYEYIKEENVYKTTVLLKRKTRNEIIKEIYGLGYNKQLSKTNAAIDTLTYLNELGYIKLNELTRKKLKIEDSKTIYGDRTVKFENLIKNILLKANIDSGYIDILLKNMDIYNKAFTSNSANLIGIVKDENSENNYEIYETLGDVVFANFIYKYVLERFPELNATKDIPVINEIKKKYASKNEFSKITRKMGFLPYITCSVKEYKQQIEILEDTFESFLGSTCAILDSNIIIGAGYAVCYDILKSIYDDIDIHTNLYLLNSPMTNLKEIFDKNESIKPEYIKSKIGNLYNFKVQIPKLEKDKLPIIAKVLDKYGILGEGSDIEENIAKEKAALDAINNLKRISLYHHLDPNNK